MGFWHFLRDFDEVKTPEVRPCAIAPSGLDLAL